MSYAPCRSVTFIPTGADFTRLECSASWDHAGPHCCYFRDRLHAWRNLDRKPKESP